MKVLVRTDAGARVGLGHLQRCLALALALRRRRAACSFIGFLEPPAVRRARAWGFRTYRLSGGEPGDERDLRRVLERIGSFKPDIIIADSYALSARYLQALGGETRVVAHIDDFAREASSCGLVVGVGAYTNSLPYRSLGGGTRFLLGTRYALLRPEFWNLAPRRTRPRVRNLLVTLGGTDPFNLMPGLLRTLDELPGTFSVSVVVGPFFKNSPRIRAAVGAVRRKVSVLRRPLSMSGIMRRADLAICAGGQTLFELAAAGTPAVTVQMARNQSENIRSFEKKGAAVSAGLARAPRVFERIGALAARLMKDPPLRRRMSRAGRRLVDGKGALRVAKELLRLVERGAG